MAKTINILRCTLCGTDNIETNSKNTYFKCKNCGFEWEVIELDVKDYDQIKELVDNPTEPNEDLKKLLKGKSNKKDAKEKNNG